MDIIEIKDLSVKEKPTNKEKINGNNSNTGNTDSQDN